MLDQYADISISPKFYEYTISTNFTETTLKHVNPQRYSSILCINTSV